ncbi:MAG TPA: hypothetical protein VIR16_02245, partial [Candidatus Limnocylindrales bacterium]
SLAGRGAGRHSSPQEAEMHADGGLTFAIAAAVLFGAPLLWLAWWFIADTTRGGDRRRPAHF